MKAIDPSDFPWFDHRRYTFSLGLTDGTAAYLSGHSASAYDPDESRIVVRGGMSEQTTTAYDKIERILDAAGSTVADAARVVEYVTAAGIEHYPEAEAVRRARLAGAEPAVCTVVVERLLRPEALIEIEVTAGTPGDVVYLPSLTAPEAGRDLVAQTEAVFAKAARALEAAGLDMGHVVKTVDYTTPATRGSYRGTGAVRSGVLGPVYPAAAGILMPRLQTPDTLISLDVIASRDEPEAVNPGWERYGALTYSPAVRAGDLLFMSGQAALDPSTVRPVHDGDIAAQAEYTYANIIEVLRAAGGGPEHLVKTIEYVTPEGLASYRDVAGVRERVLRAPWPASTGCVCAGLLRPEFLIEIDPFAVLSERT